MVVVVSLRGQESILAQNPGHEGETSAGICPASAMFHPHKPAGKTRGLIINFCVHTTLLFLNALQTTLTILNLSADLDTALSRGPHCNVWHELQSLLRTSKMVLRKKGNKHFIRLG